MAISGQLIHQWQRFVRWLKALFCICFLSLTLFQVVKAAVTLVYFDAWVDYGEILLIWETASEIDNAGFYINRSLNQSGPYSRVSGFIVSVGDILGGYYEYLDTQVVPGTTYWYKLESISLNNVSAFYEPPLSVIPLGNSPTPTRTPTGGLSSTATITPTRTPLPTRTTTPFVFPTWTSPAPGQVNPAYPGGVPIQSTPVLPPDLTGTALSLNEGGLETTLESGFATATYEPLPDVEMQFPTSEPIQLPEIEQDSPASRWDWLTPAWVGLAGFLLITWIAMGAWFYFSFRRRN